MQAASYISIYAEKAAQARARHAITTDPRDADYLLRQARKYENLSNGARESAQRDAVKVEAAQPVPVAKVEAKPAKVRCAFYKQIRAFYVVAKKAGLNCENKKGMRAALSAYLGKTVVSRADLEASDWSRAIDGIECRAIWW